MAGHFSCTHEALHRFTATSQSLGPDTLQLTEEDLEFVSEYLAEQYSRPVTAYDVAMSEESGIASASARINGMHLEWIDRPKVPIEGIWVFSTRCRQIHGVKAKLMLCFIWLKAQGNALHYSDKTA